MALRLLLAAFGLVGRDPRVDLGGIAARRARPNRDRAGEAALRNERVYLRNGDTQRCGDFSVREHGGLLVELAGPSPAAGRSIPLHGWEVPDAPRTSVRRNRPVRVTRRSGVLVAGHFVAERSPAVLLLFV